jgi:chromosome segregation ATPase
MNDKDKQFFQIQLNTIESIQKQINDLENHFSQIMTERDKKYDERKTSYDKKQDELHGAIVKLFGKTDALQNELSTVVNQSIQILHSDIKNLDNNIIKKVDLQCSIHGERLKQMEGSVNRIYGWIMAMILSIVGVFFKK